MFLIRLVSILESRKIPYAIVGGYAVALHGAVRGTVDVDLVIKLGKKSFRDCEEALHRLGLESRLPLKAEQVFEFREEYIQNRNLVAWNFFNPQQPSETVDIILTHDVSKMKIEKIKLAKGFVRVVSVPDLIEMKTRSGRPQDLADIQALRKLKK
jgi:hypothetical protein